MKQVGGTVLGLRGSTAIKMFEERTTDLNIPIEVTATLGQNFKKLLAHRGRFFVFNHYTLIEGSKNSAIRRRWSCFLWSFMKPRIGWRFQRRFLRKWCRGPMSCSVNCKRVGNCNAYMTDMAICPNGSSMKRMMANIVLNTDQDRAMAFQQNCPLLRISGGFNCELPLNGAVLAG